MHGRGVIFRVICSGRGASAVSHLKRILKTLIADSTGAIRDGLGDPAILEVGPFLKALLVGAMGIPKPSHMHKL